MTLRVFHLCKIKAIAFLTLALLSFSCFGQVSKTVAEDFKKMNDAYDKYNDLSVVLVYNLYEDANTNKPFETKSGFYKKHNGIHFTKTGTVEMLQSTRFFIVKDSKSKKIVMAHPVLNLKPKITLFSLDSMLAFCNKVTVEETKAQMTFKMHYDKLTTLGFKDVEITLNKENYFIQKMIFLYSTPMKKGIKKDEKPIKPRMEILFSNYAVSNQKDGLFSENNYIKKTNNKTEVSDLCKGYTLINQAY